MECAGVDGVAVVEENTEVGVSFASPIVSRCSWSGCLPVLCMELCSCNPLYLLWPRALKAGKLRPVHTQWDGVSRFLSTWMLCSGASPPQSLFIYLFQFVVKEKPEKWSRSPN